MKILLVNKFHFRKGGAETYYFSLADGLRKFGHEVIFFSMNHPKNLECEQKRYFTTYREYNDRTSIYRKISALKNIIYSKEAYKKIGQLLDDEKPDLVILNNIHRQITPSIIDAINERGIKVFWVMHDLMALCPNYTMLNSKNEICEKCATKKYNNCVKYKCIKNSLIKSLIAAKEARFNSKKNIYKNVDLLIAPSDFYRNKFIEYGFDENKIITLRNPLPVDTEFEVNNMDEKYILYFGRLSKEKGIKTLIDVMKDIDYKLIIAGVGPIEKELKTYVLKNHITNVIFVGYLQGMELKDCVRKSRCVVLPSEWYENGPYSAMEAMSLGKPLIVSNMGGLPELIEHNKNGFIFDNFDQLHNYINYIINCSKEKYNDLCLNSKIKSIELFSMCNYLFSLKKLMED